MPLQHHENDVSQCNETSAYRSGKSCWNLSEVATVAQKCFERMLRSFFQRHEFVSALKQLSSRTPFLERNNHGILKVLSAFLPRLLQIRDVVTARIFAENRFECFCHTLQEMLGITLLSSRELCFAFFLAWEGLGDSGCAWS